MTSGLEKQSATIYQFPVKRRVAAVRHHDDSAAELQPQSGAGVDFTGWYHGAAVQDARRVGGPDRR